MKNKKLFAILTLVCFMFTLMPVAAFAAIDTQQSWIYADDEKVKVNKDATLTFDLNDTVTTLYVWFEEATNVPSTALVGATDGVLEVAVAGTDGEIEVKFNRAGVYELHAATVNPLAQSGTTKAEKVAAAADYELKTETAYKTIEVVGDTAKTDLYALEDVNGVFDTTTLDNPGYISDNESVSMTVPFANGAYTEAVTLKLVDTDNAFASVYAPSINIDTTSGVNVTNVEVKRSGIITFDVTANKVGNHKIYVAVDEFKATIKVDATDSIADSIEVVKAPKTPINFNNLALGGDLAANVVFEILDANGNEIDTATLGLGIDGALQSADGLQPEYRNYVAVTEKPADSALKSQDVNLVLSRAGEWTIGFPAGAFDEEGTYGFKVVLDNGEYATVSFKVLKADDPTSMNISYYSDSVQLGATIAPAAIVWLDAKYVSSTIYAAAAGGWRVPTGTVEIAVTGAAVESFDETTATITVKDDEKYVGSEIVVTVVDEENNLIATKTLTVAAEAKELVFATNAIPVNATKTIEVSLVDENGNSVGLQATTAEAYVIVLPNEIEGEADVVTGSLDKADGTFDIAVSADAVGTFKVQAVLKATVDNVVRYYTGTQEIKVGATGIEDTVVMSIGANKIVVNDEVVAIDAAPMIKDSRTFVPFRALAEAFGAVVEFDAATQAVVAELDGTKVVMTIGSEVYTVNGVAKTADVAPFISDSRTMVPVRFVAEAFGINVTPIAAEDGSIADVLFTK